MLLTVDSTTVAIRKIKKRFQNGFKALELIPFNVYLFFL